MSKSVDPKIYFEPQTILAYLFQSPGFPNLRLNPIIVVPEVLKELPKKDEYFLLGLHLEGYQYLVASTNFIAIYQIPQLKTGLQSAASIGFKVGIGMIPIVGELVDAGEKLMKPVEWIKGFKERKEDKVKAAEGMPTKEYIKVMRWNFRDADTLKLIQIYRERILMENGFEWKEVYKASLADPTQKVEIVLGEKDINITVGNHKTSANYLDTSWAPLEIAETHIELNRAAIEAGGWTVTKADRQIIFRK